MAATADDIEIEDRPRATLTQFTTVYVLTGFGIVAAMLAAEVTDNLLLYRLKYSIWLPTALLIPALFLYTVRADSQAGRAYHRLFWTGALAAYLVHFYLAVFVYFDGLLGALEGQGMLIAGMNYVITVVWALDVLVLWLVADPMPAIVRLWRLVATAIVFAGFVVATVVLKEGVVSVLGTLLAVAAGVGIAIGYLRRL